MIKNFLDSVVKQFGRDTGKVISNKVYKDKHASPYRKVESNSDDYLADKSKNQILRKILRNELPTSKQKAKNNLIDLKSQILIYSHYQKIDNFKYVNFLQKLYIESIQYIDKLIIAHDDETTLTLADELVTIIEELQTVKFSNKKYLLIKISNILDWPLFTIQIITLIFFFDGSYNFLNFLGLNTAIANILLRNLFNPIKKYDKNIKYITEKYI